MNEQFVALGKPYSAFDIFKFIPEDRFLAMSSQEKTLIADFVRICIRLYNTSKRSYGYCITCGSGTGHKVPICSQCVNRIMALNDPKLPYFKGGKWPQRSVLDA